MAYHLPMEFEWDQAKREAALQGADSTSLRC